MQVKAIICQPTDICQIIIPEFDLCDIPISENLIEVNEQRYIVCSTLFNDYSGLLIAEFEQIIRPFTHGESGPKYPPHLLLRGKIYFDDEAETNIILKTILARGRDVNGEIKAPYNYMRWRDCINIDNYILLCEEITIKDNIRIDVRFYGSPITIEKFRTDGNEFYRRMH
jgi:hypothetical protein